jgi:hypothetical protein
LPDAFPHGANLLLHGFQFLFHHGRQSGVRGVEFEVCTKLLTGIERECEDLWGTAAGPYSYDLVVTRCQACDQCPASTTSLD